MTTLEFEPLTAYRITLSDGTDYVTSMAASVTLADARRHFLGQPVYHEHDGLEIRKTIKAVDPA